MFNRVCLATTMITVIVTVLSTTLYFSIFFVKEGDVGVVYRMGRLVPGVMHPGLNLVIPGIDLVELVQVTVQTDSVTNIPCGTLDGTMLTFNRIEVVNQLPIPYVNAVARNFTTSYDKLLIYDKIHHEMNQFCSNYTLQYIYVDGFSTIDDHLRRVLQESLRLTGIEIIAVRVTKPVVPDKIQDNYDRIGTEITQLVLAEQVQLVEKKKAETERMVKIIEAEMNATLKNISYTSRIQEQHMRRTIGEINNTMFLEHRRAISDARFYDTIKTAEANERMLTPAYLESEKFKAISENTKLYFGPDIPNFFQVGTGYVETTSSSRDRAM